MQKHEEDDTMKALIADDSMVSRRILFGVLQHEVEIQDIDQAADGAEALKAIQEGHYDVILLDWNMPNMQGIDVLREVRAAGSKVPVIMVTSESDKAHVLEAYEAGANNYIVKPFSPQLVAEKVKKTLDRASGVSKDRPGLRGLVVDDSAVARKIFQGVLEEQCGFEEIVKAADGQEAVDAVKDGQFDLILLDWNMPNMLGIDALRAIRGLGNKTPVIMVTTEKEGSRVLEAFDAGANNYIIKPFEPSQLAEKVKLVLHVHA